MSFEAAMVLTLDLQRWSWKILKNEMHLEVKSVSFFLLSFIFKFSFCFKDLVFIN